MSRRADAPARRAIVLGLVALERLDGRDAGWDLASVLVAAKHEHAGEGPAPDQDHVRGLLEANPRLIHRRTRDGRYELTEVGRARAREGSL